MTTRTGARGFTLIELMVSMVLSGIVIAFVFQIHGQMSSALRTQANVSEVGETVTNAREMIAREIRTAGIGFPKSGARIGFTQDLIMFGVTARNDWGAVNDWSDFLEIQRAKGETAVIDPDPHPLDLGIDRTTDPTVWRFHVWDSGARPVDLRLDFLAIRELMIATADDTSACVVPVTGVTKVVPQGFDIDKNYFLPEQAACSNVISPTANTARITVLERVTFNLDQSATGIAQGVLQRGDGWANPPMTIGVGFTNFQVAVRYLEVYRWPDLATADADTVDDLDGDGDEARDWYSGVEMEPFHAGRFPSVEVLQVGFSLEARNLTPIDGVVSTATPGFIDMAFESNNPLGDWGTDCAGLQYDPCGVPDLSAGGLPARYRPKSIYRSSSTTVWLRNRLGSL